MVDVSQKLKKLNVILYLTIGLAVINSWWYEMITTDYAHEIFSEYFFAETAILILTFIPGFKSKWTRIFVGLLTVAEASLFYLDSPIDPDELVMIIIFGLRVYILFVLFSKELNQFYQKN